MKWGHEDGELAAHLVRAVIWGVIGARLYHVVTDYQNFEGDWLRALADLEGGLSIWGAVLGGVLADRHRAPRQALRHARHPGLRRPRASSLAQAIGRWGNYFNQELFGEPTDLPWGLEIDPANRPLGFEGFATFHPTFLYESLFCLAIVGGLLWAERRWRLKRGQVFALYVASYTVRRASGSRTCASTTRALVGGLRVNAWIVGGSRSCSGSCWFWWLGRHGSVDEGKYDRIGRDRARSGIA